MQEIRIICAIEFFCELVESDFLYNKFTLYNTVLYNNALARDPHPTFLSFSYILQIIF